MHQDLRVKSPQRFSIQSRCTSKATGDSQSDISSTALFLSKCFISGSLRHNSLRSRQNDKAFFYMFAIVTGLLLCTVVKGEFSHRIPAYQDVETALRSTKCAVREEIVDIRDIHPHLPPDVLLLPSCILIRKCSGCCQNSRHVCKPTAIYVTRVEVSQQHVVRRRLDYITLNFTHHDECECMSPIEPTCIPRACARHELWNKEACECEPRCQPQECGHGQVWNPRKCRCACSPCHPNRLVHLRFDQNDVTCICACRHELRHRTRCAKRRATFSQNSCACVGHFARGK
uniref:vascular endothelial growth factor A-A-like n=1 Tax=Ciona intestinalis TaxID=7719 RepID=UPI00006A334B|nr:vascular endothelial growth factor A-A-like [Ciona intestinalis]|eukprot:XP_002128012.1 vascular endothelial growth factor A-A-like [Ciona intestinalis]